MKKELEVVCYGECCVFMKVVVEVMHCIFYTKTKGERDEIVMMYMRYERNEYEVWLEEHSFVCSRWSVCV